MWLIDLIKNLFIRNKPVWQPGANFDERPFGEKQKDIKFKEIVVAANPVNWVEKPKSKWRRFKDQDQNGSGSCVAQTIRKLAGILLFLKEGRYEDFSATHIYQRRFNKPNPGMMGVDAFEIWKQGITLEFFAPSEKLTDSEMDNFQIEKYEEEIGKVFSINGHIGLPITDFETVASVIQTTGKGVMVWFYFIRSEWTREIPRVEKYIKLIANTTMRHSVAAVDYFLINGKKYLLIEDSSHFGGWTYHLISEEFYRVRNWFARYPMNFRFQKETINRPEYFFAKVLEFGMIDPDIVALQNILKYEGLFPTNVGSTGYYGAITSEGVYKFQVKYQVASEEELISLQGRKVGPKTKDKLNELFK